MTITLLDGYYIDADSLNYTLKRKIRKVKKDGTEYDADRIVGYFGSLKKAVRAFLVITQQSSEDVVDLKAFVEYVEESNMKTAKEIKELLEGRYLNGHGV